MWTCCPSGSPAQANHITAIHVISLLNFKLRKVKVKGHEPLAMVDDDTVPFEKHKSCQHNRPAVQGSDWCAGRNREIQPLMCTLYCSIKLSLRAKDIRNAGIDGSHEIAGPFAFRRNSRKNLLLDGFILCGFF